MNKDSLVEQAASLAKPDNAEEFYKFSKFITKSIAGGLAPVGLSGLATEFFDLVVSDPAVKRRDRIIVEIVNRLVQLEQSGRILLSDLEGDEEVAALLFKTVQAAMRSSGENKLLSLRNAAVRGIAEKSPTGANAAQTVVSTLDRMTELHVIALSWLKNSNNHYTIGAIADGPVDSVACRSCFYGQPVTRDKASLKDPVMVWYHPQSSLYVERREHDAFALAHAELVAMGLLSPIYKKRARQVERRVEYETTSEIETYEVSQLGTFVLKYLSDE